jgi:anthranilate phosphoribosyltransferase
MSEDLPFIKVIAEVESAAGLTAITARQAFDEILDGLWTPAQIAGLLVGLRAKPDSPTIIAAAAQSLRAAMLAVNHHHEKLVDTCGTGGDGHGTLNLSTGAAIMLAAAGITVAKHGNRAMSSRTGAADVLEKLGIPINLGPDAAAGLLDEVGIAFLLAPTHHPAMRYAAPVRRELGIRTLFNCLGPLANPAGAKYQLLGAYEVSPFGPTRVTELTSGCLTELEIAPEDFGIRRSKAGAIAGADPEYNALILSDVLEGKPHPSRDAFIINAASALVVAESITLRDAAARMQQVLDSGAAKAKLDAWRLAAQRRSMSV